MIRSLLAVLTQTLKVLGYFRPSASRTLLRKQFMKTTGYEIRQWLQQQSDTLNYESFDYCLAAVSATDFICARPFSKSPPTILSMFMKRPNAFPMKLLSPSIVHVTAV